MEGERGYEESWEIAFTATGIRPAKKEEVIRWLKGHPEDAPFAETCQIAGTTMRE